MNENSFAYVAGILNEVWPVVSITVPLIEPQRNSRGKTGHIRPAAVEDARRVRACGSTVAKQGQPKVIHPEAAGLRLGGVRLG